MIEWQEWSWETFNKSRIDKKPILLSISATWCHWCHVMDRTTYADPDVAAMINSRFTPVRVDTDKRPDINERYNQGGWPTTAFLTHKGILITGATYIPPKDMLSAMQGVLKFYAEHQDEIGKAELSLDIKKPAEKTDSKATDRILETIQTGFDVRYGGYGSEPKFPMPEMIELLLLRHVQTKEKDYLWLAEKTLDNMMFLLDKVEGGFFRYSVTKDWTIPHYEKMLYVNAGAVQNYVHAYLLTQKAAYKDAVEKTLTYVENNLLGPDGQLYGSQDADEEYYRSKRLDSAPKVDKTVYTSTACQMISALVEASAIDKKWMLLAQRAMEFITSSMVDEKGVYHYYINKAEGSVASDHIYLMRALVDMYMATAEIKYLDAAEKIAAMIKEKFWDGGINDIEMNDNNLGALRIPNKHILDNCVASQYFSKLHAITKKEEYRRFADVILRFFADSYGKYGPYASQYAIALETFSNPVEIVVVDEAPFRYYDQRAAVTYMTAEEGKKAGYDKGVYMCSDGKCTKVR